MAKSKYSYIIILCCVFSLYSVATGGGPKSRINKRFSSGWNEHHPGYYHTQVDPRHDFENGVSVKKALGLSKIIFSPFLVPVIIPMIFFVGILLLLFFAVVGSATVAGGALGRRVPYRHISKHLSSTAKLARDVLGSEECVERISCEIFRKTKGLQVENWIGRMLKSLPMKENLISRISRSMKTTSECQEFNCLSVSKIERAMKFFQ